MELDHQRDIVVVLPTKSDVSANAAAAAMTELVGVDSDSRITVISFSVDEDGDADRVIPAAPIVVPVAVYAGTKAVDGVAAVAEDVYGAIKGWFKKDDKN